MLDDFDLEAAIEQASDCPHNAIVGGNPDHGDGVDPMMFEACEELLSRNLEGSVDDGDILIRVAGEQFCAIFAFAAVDEQIVRSEEHTSELQSLMRISYAVFCLKKKTIT